MTYNAEMKLATLQQRLRPLCAATGIQRLGVFGSVARGDDNPTSDVDVIVRFKKPVGMFDLIALEERIETILGRPVDLGTEASLHPLIRDNVQRDLKIVYEE